MITSTIKSRSKHDDTFKNNFDDYVLQGVSFLPELSKNEDTELPLGGPSGQRARNSRPPKAAEIFFKRAGY